MQINIRLFSCELHFNPNKYKEVYNESTYSESDGCTLKYGVMAQLTGSYIRKF